jgi:hypothetical protein
LVRWAKVKRPKKLGGLGVLDMECFNRVLHLRWFMVVVPMDGSVTPVGGNRGAVTVQ